MTWRLRSYGGGTIEDKDGRTIAIAITLQDAHAIVAAHNENATLRAALVGLLAAIKDAANCSRQGDFAIEIPDTLSHEMDRAREILTGVAP